LSEVPSPQYDDAAIAAKWKEFAEAVERLAERVADPEDFGLRAGSSIAGDDDRCHPFDLSQAVRHLINATVDQLHGIKTVLVDADRQHLAVGFTLARAAIENTATALWILGPTDRRTRLERVLRWHVRNYQDERQTVGHLVGNAPNDHIDQVVQLASKLMLDSMTVAKGYKITAPIKGAEEFTDMDVNFMWSVASGFAHGRPWAFQGLLQREHLEVADGHKFMRLSPRTDLSIWLPLQALHLLGELLRLREVRAGYAPSPRGNHARPGGAFYHPEM